MIDSLKAEHSRMRDALEGVLEMGDPGTPELYEGMIEILVYPDRLQDAHAALEDGKK